MGKRFKKNAMRFVPFLLSTILGFSRSQTSCPVLRGGNECSGLLIPNYRGVTVIGLVCSELVGDNLEIAVTVTLDRCELKETHICNIPTEVFSAETHTTSFTYNILIDDVYSFVCPFDDEEFLVAAHADIECESGGTFQAYYQLTLICDACAGGGGGVTTTTTSPETTTTPETTCSSGWISQEGLPCNASNGCGKCINKEGGEVVPAGTMVIGPFNINEPNVKRTFTFNVESQQCQVNGSEALAIVAVCIENGAVGSQIRLDWEAAAGYVIDAEARYFGAAGHDGDYLDLTQFNWQPFPIPQTASNISGSATQSISLSGLNGDVFWISVSGSACQVP